MGLLSIGIRYWNPEYIQQFTNVLATAKQARLTEYNDECYNVFDECFDRSRYQKQGQVITSHMLKLQ